MARGDRERGAARGPEPETLEEAVEQLQQARRRLARRNKDLSECQMKLATVADGGEIRGMQSEKVIWVFCTGRSGSTWLGSMMGDVEGHVMWNEPLVGALFGEFYYVRASHKRGGAGILGTPYRGIWLKSIRSMVLDGATARYPEVAREGGYVVIKEPHGSVGAPLLREALPESRVVFLVRDPRDVISSAIDAQSEGSWTSKNKRWDGKKPLTEADTNPDLFVRKRAKTYLQDISNAKEAYEAHEGPKAQVRYEDLRADTLGTMKRVYSELRVSVEEGELARVVHKHAWENIPEEDKGQGKFYRKATPEGWREDLTPGQVEIVENVTAPLLEEFYAR